MGRTYLFECTKCVYHVRVAGGPAEGIHFAVQTIACADCKALYDAVTRFRLSPRQIENPPRTPPPCVAALNRLTPRGVERWMKFKLACPVTASHRVRQWRQPDKCPKCGNFMEPG